MYRFLKRYRLTINILVFITAMTILVLKKEGVVNSYSIIGFVLTIGALFNILLQNESTKRKKRLK